MKNPFQQVAKINIILSYLRAKGVIKSLFTGVYDDLEKQALEVLKMDTVKRDNLQIVGVCGDGGFLYGNVYEGMKKIWETTNEAQFVEALRQFRI